MSLYITMVQGLEFPPVPVGDKGQHQSSLWILLKTSAD